MGRKNYTEDFKAIGYFRLPEILKIIPVSKSTWWDGVRNGIYPRGRPIGPRSTGWRKEDIFELIERIDSSI